MKEDTEIFKVGDKVYVVDWGQRCSDVYRWIGEVKEKVFNWKTEIPNYSSPDFFCTHTREPVLTKKRLPRQKPPYSKVTKTIRAYENFKYEIVEIIPYPEAGQYVYENEYHRKLYNYYKKYPENMKVYLLRGKENWDENDILECFVQITSGGISLLTPAQFASNKFNAMVESHRGKHSVDDIVEGKIPGFPEELIKHIYDRNDNVLFGSSMVKGKISYPYVDGRFTVDGIPFLLHTSILYDGKGNKDLPEDVEMMHFHELPALFKNNKFAGE